ncbi:hypothetical protein HGRIS_007856 [Hohenbuehelia grisea]|uniref:Uncharacterized protein n=1 Tax=Hohenbuehelia grisea TaxID=104357 RepID=A0ABR3J6L5_9AGAR
MARRIGTNKDIRSASHAGDWYTSDAGQLDQELTTWLAEVSPQGDTFPIAGCKAIIAPHAGYSYSGPAAAWAYKSIDTTGIKRVFILGPSHHFYLEGCALSSCKEYETPIGKLPLDLATIEELHGTREFEKLTHKADEAEHSIEMHLPYVRKIFEGIDIKIVPIVVGAIGKDLEAKYGKLLAPYLAREDTFCVVSSDFCHWGTRFQYTYYYPEPAPSTTSGYRLSHSKPPAPGHAIHESIERLDREAMDLLTCPPASGASAHSSFADYLARTKNTICGRHPIGVLLGALSEVEKGETVGEGGIGRAPVLKWVRYEQSSACEDIRDSSVSYASAWVRF